jgi:hypothetical protein
VVFGQLSKEGLGPVLREHARMRSNLDNSVEVNAKEAVVQKDQDDLD